MATYHLAQYNIARIKAELEAPLMHGFVSQLDFINGLSERAPGFVWRHQTEDGNSTAVRPYPDRTLLITLSVWESVESLADFVYRDQHAEMLRQRDEWFTHIEGFYIVLWWIPAGHAVEVEEGVERLEHLRRHGPSPHAFTFQRRFPAPGSDDAGSAAVADEPR
jgi:heme-degrading monooxygenase HmoA